MAVTMTDPTSKDLTALTADDLDGHTIEELADYVDRGRTPPDPTIERSSSCRHAIAALERLRSVSAGFLSDGPEPAEDDAWLADVMSQISIDARAGADFTVLTTDAGDEVVMTEGALRALVRAAGDEQPGFLVGRVRFSGDLSDPDAELTVAVDVVVGYGVRLGPAVERLRTAIIERLTLHTMFRTLRIDVVVRDLVLPKEGR
jgi:hypothetical protein